jgi:hypothetical protein
MAVYFIGNHKRRAIKIGTARSPLDRMKTLQTGTHDRLTMLGAIPGDASVESEWHSRFQVFRCGGEWFRPRAELIKAIRDAVRTRGILTLEPKHPFLSLVKLEPDLVPAYRLAASYQAVAMAKRSFCANAVWYGYYKKPGIKPEVSRLVGWLRPDKNPRLSTMRAYDVAYKAVYEALPDCGEKCDCQQIFAALLGVEL